MERSSPPAPAPFLGQIEHVILRSHLISPSHPVTEDSLLLQWRQGEGGGEWESKSGHTFLHTHTIQTTFPGSSSLPASQPASQLAALGTSAL
ncbi:hypothetical protein NQZ68_003781 [Dissostichus eleginoides]|nr:hypothetical protein NQZ68_003781 [Dissostichus eleginoides]